MNAKELIDAIEDMDQRTRSALIVFLVENMSLDQREELTNWILENFA